MRCAPRPRPGPRTSPSATPTAAACPPSSARRPRPWSTALGDGVEVGIHTHNDAECAVANSLAAVEAGARLVQGTRQRLRRALRQRQPRLDPARAAAEDGLRGRQRRAAREPDADRPLPRRALQHDRRTPTSPTSAATPSPTRPACTPPASPPTPAPSSTSTRPGRQRAARSSPPSSPARRRSAARPSRPGLELDDEAAARAVERLKEREHRGYHYEAAPASFELLLRREAGSYEPLFKLESFRVVDREARRRRGRDRGDDQGRGRRRALRARRRGQRPGQRPRPGAARRRSSTATRTSPRSS